MLGKLFQRNKQTIPKEMATKNEETKENNVSKKRADGQKKEFSKGWQKENK